MIIVSNLIVINLHTTRTIYRVPVMAVIYIDNIGVTFNTLARKKALYHYLFTRVLSARNASRRI